MLASIQLVHSQTAWRNFSILLSLYLLSVYLASCIAPCLAQDSLFWQWSFGFDVSYLFSSFGYLHRDDLLAPSSGILHTVTSLSPRSNHYQVIWQPQHSGDTPILHDRFQYRWETSNDPHWHRCEKSQLDGHPPRWYIHFYCYFSHKLTEK